MFNFATEPITQLPKGTTVLGSDTYPAVDTTDLRESNSGTTKKYTISQLSSFLSIVASGSNKQSCLVATTGALTASYNNGSSGVAATLTNSGLLAPLAIDGISMAIGNRVLVAFQISQFQNGIYIVSVVGDALTPWVLTRAADYNGSLNATISQGDFVGIISGNTNRLTFWFQVAPGPFIIGTSAIIFESQNIVSAEPWIVANASAVMNVNNGYIANTPALCLLSLPSIANIGDIIKVQGRGAGLYRILQGPGQQIFYGDVSTTLGNTGYLASADRRDFVSLLCTNTNVEFSVMTTQGNLVFV